VNATTDFLSIPQGRLEIRRIAAARSDAPTLVFLHEGLGCVGLWRDFPDRVAAATGCGALIYSRFGYGASDPAALPRPLSYMHDEALTVLPEVLRAAGIGAHVLIGHSDGGSIALIHAGSAATPGLKGVVTMAAHVFVEDISITSIAAARQQWDSGDLRTRLARWHGANVDCAFLGWNQAWLDPAFRDWNIEDHLAGIRVPVLVMQGEDDEYGTLAQVESIRAHCGAETLVLPNCGHSPQRDQPATVIAALNRFIAPLL
jgi:pimeloyl-ACP methyl ester carboxylesterase